MQASNAVKYHDAWKSVVGADGILVPGGFGTRGTDGMMLAIRHAREQKVPFLGICLGFQLAVIEWAQNVMGDKGTFINDILSIPPQLLIILNFIEATSEEFDPSTQHAAIVFMPEISKTHMGGTMRLGLRPTVFQSGSETYSMARKLYGGAGKIWERHRHRYEVNPAWVEKLAASGLDFVGRDEKGERMQVLEIKGKKISIEWFWFKVVRKDSDMVYIHIDHPFFLGLQAHPEFCTRPLNPSPPFLGFVAASSGPEVLDEQVRVQQAYKPPHPEEAMVSEDELRKGQKVELHNIVSGTIPADGQPVPNGDATA